MKSMPPMPASPRPRPALTNAQSQLAREKVLTTDGFSTEARLDVATRDMATASANFLMAQAGHGVAIRRVAAAEAALTANAAMLARARHKLLRCQISHDEFMHMQLQNGFNRFDNFDIDVMHGSIFMSLRNLAG